MSIIVILLILAALICFLLDAFGAAMARVKLTPLGLALLTLYLLLLTLMPGAV